MPTEATLEAVVLGGRASSPWLVARTVRALARHGVRATTLDGDEALAAHLGAARQPTWVVRAGAWPLAGTSSIRPSASGRPLVGFGATSGDAAWRAVLSETGGDLRRARRALPRVDSLFIQQPEGFSAFVAKSGSLERACEAAAESDAVRAVRVPSLDVGHEDALRVVEVVTTLHRGGAERIALDLTRELRGRGHHVVFAVLDRATRSTFEAPEGAIAVHELARDRAARIDLLGAIAREHAADVIHAHLLDGDELARLSRSEVPIVVTVHNARSGWPARFERGSGAAAILVACARGVANDLDAAGLGGRVRVAWNGIVPSPEASIARDEARDALGLPREELVLLAVANHRPQKRLDRMPAVVAALRSKGKDARLVLVGEPVRTDPASLAVAARIREEASRVDVSDVVSLAGSRADVRSAYAAADVVLSTSAFEGLSLAHLESIDAGVPLVTTRVSGAEELAAKHPHVHVVDLEAPAEAIATAVLAAHGGVERPALAPDFTTRKMADRYVDLFSRAARNTSHGARRGGLVLVTNNFSTGGAQSSARRLLVGLAKVGVSVNAVVIEEQAAYPTPGRAALVAEGVSVFVAPRAGSVDPMVTARAVVERIDAIGPDTVLFWNVIPEHKVLIADLLLGVPVWDVSPGEMYFASFERYLRRPRVGSPYLTTKDYGRLLEGAIVKYASEKTRAEEALGTRVAVVPNGVVVPSAPPRREGRERVVIGTLARISPDKKLEQLVDAAARLPCGVEIRIAGALERGFEDYAAMLRERSAALPIVWAGERDSAAFLAEIDLFAMISEPAGCPNASLEAMASGLAVVATDHGGARDQIVDGETGIVVPRGDSSAVGDALSALVADPERRAAYGAAGHARAREAFHEGRMVEAYARVCLPSWSSAPVRAS